MTQFGTEGSAPGQLNSPVGIKIDRSTDLLYVTKYSNHCISVFTNAKLEGQFVHSFVYSFGENQFFRPTGITTDRKGALYVCDKDNHRLVVF